MMGLFKAPKQASPFQTAAAQTTSNQQTAQYQQGLNMVNQYTPYGSLTYTGSNDGQPGHATAVQTLSPSEQALFGQDQSNQLGESQLTGQQVGRLQSTMGQTFDPNYDVNLQKGYGTKSMDQAINDKITGIGMQRLDPQWKQNSEDFQQSMANRGIHPGSQAYNMAKEQFDQSKNDAYNSLYTNAFSSASGAAQNDTANAANLAAFGNNAQVSQNQFNAQQAYAKRNQTLNEVNSLQSGSQVQQPTFTNTPQTQVAGTNVAGIQQAYDQNKSANYQSALGGVFGLAGDAASFATKKWG